MSKACSERSWRRTRKRASAAHLSKRLRMMRRTKPQRAKTRKAYQKVRDRHACSLSSLLTCAAEEQLVRWRAKKKHFFILSAAGKPIYSRHGTESITSSYIGVIQAIISFFADNGDTLQSFESGGHRFAVTSSGPLYLVAISSLGETPSQLRAQLDALYTQVLSTLTLSQLNKIFSHRYNFDLRRLLGGTEVFLDGLVDSMTRGSPQVLLSALECVKIRKTYRERINNLLLKTRSQSLLYGLVVADQRLVSVVRPKRHSLHPPDLQLLFSMLFNASTFRDGSEHWTPICMPKFNSKGFLHAYIHFFQPDICVVLISADKDAFFEMREMAANVIAGLKSSSLLSHIVASIPRYTPTDLVPGTPIRHFLYKSRQNVQFTMPAWGGHYTTQSSRRRVMTLYHKLHASVHAKSAHLKVCFCSRKQEETLAWVLPGFELYVVAAPGAKREAVAKGAQKIVNWVRNEEERLFVIGGATF
ncbi:vacuolar fusion protein MON1 [Sphaerosporella brunnea]|uniref:Vacuolar fusion protein MON1 n=1 Tax=Sphaerosporella brunnea TaxID=1250544 RepID=A0A5J5EQE1_9PEZI|nr:vacuolar fusion protein MON1 [Sphaerosporella brunnea]